MSSLGIRLTFSQPTFNPVSHPVIIALFKANAKFEADLGIGSDYDFWQIEIQLEDGGPVFRNDGWKQCNLRDAGKVQPLLMAILPNTIIDKESKGPNVFRVAGETFYIGLRSVCASLIFTQFFLNLTLRSGG